MPCIPASLRPFCLLGAVLAYASAVEFHVAVEAGDDFVHDGSPEQPFASLIRARDALREWLATATAPEAATVIIHGGTYRLTAPLRLTAADGGSAAHPVTWRAAEGAEVLITGGTVIDGPWRQDENGHWLTDLPEHLHTVRFRQLFIDDERQTRARYPDAGKALLNATDTTMPIMYLEPGHVRQDWAEEPDAQLWANISWNGYNVICDIDAVDQDANAIHLSGETGHYRLVGAGSTRAYHRPDWCFIEGARSACDAPGEWYRDLTHQTLRYVPGADPRSATVVAPHLDTLIELAGDPITGSHIEHVTLEGLTLAHVRYNLGQPEPRECLDGALRLINARYCTIQDCEIRQVGGNAIQIEYDSTDNLITGNHLHDLGANGVMVLGARGGWMGQKSHRSDDRRLWTLYPSRSIITQNRIEDGGLIRVYAGGVHLGSAPMRHMFADKALIAHNEFHNLAKFAAFGFRYNGGMVMEFNKASLIGWAVRDTGAYYFASMSQECADSWCLNNWAEDMGNYTPYPGTTADEHVYGAFYTDGSTKTVHVRNNYATNVILKNKGTPPVHMNGSRNPIEGNQLDGPPHPGIRASEIGIGSTASNDIQIPPDGGVAVEWFEPGVHRIGAGWEELSINGANGQVVNYTCEQLSLAADSGDGHQLVIDLPVPRGVRYRLYYYFWDEGRGDGARNLPITVTYAGGQNTIGFDLTTRHETMRASRYHHGHPLGEFEFQAGQANLQIDASGADGRVYFRAVALKRID
ncbi:MAG: right-handed parallel beta-helix repeat-containing protein [Planctomycetota bacterium]